MYIVRVICLGVCLPGWLDFGDKFVGHTLVLSILVTCIYRKTVIGGYILLCVTDKGPQK